MKRLSLWARPLVLVGVAVACACGEPSAPAAVATAASPAATPPRRMPRNFTPSSYHKSNAAEASRSKGTVTTDDHKVFGPIDKLQYFGGRVISNVNVIGIDWLDVSDPADVVDPAVVSVLPDFFATITASPYFTWLAEYNTVGLTPGSNQTIGYGTFDTTSAPGGTGVGGTYLITPTINTTHTLANSDIGSELAYQLEIGALPAPTYDADFNVNNLYVFDFPPDFVITLEGMTSCKDFCGYHFTIQYGPEFISVPYAVLIDVSSLGCGGCGSGKTVDNATSIHSHELIEAMTDTEVGLGSIAWYDETDIPGGESADLCETLPPTTVSGYTVQTIWSNVNGSCIATAPLCNGSTSPPSCTPCTNVGAPACSGKTPDCQTDTTDPKYGECIGCLTSSECSGATAFCDPTTEACRGCAAGDCVDPTPVCETGGLDNGKCVQCDATHTSACTGATPTCETLDFVCVGCVENSNCSGTTPVCGPTQSCQACASDSDCAPDVCAPSGACVGCLKNSDCGAETCDTSTNECQCSDSSQCKNPKPVCGSGKACGPCMSNGDCAGNAVGDVCDDGSCVQCAKDSDCSGSTPVCNVKSRTCEGSSGHDGGGPPPGDAGKKADSGSGGGGGGGQTTTGGCATAPGDAGTSGVPLLAMAGLALVAARRRRRGSSASS